MAFAGKLLDLKVSPYMLDVLLVYSYDKNAAWGLYDEIMNMTKKQQTLQEEINVNNEYYIS